MPPAALLAAPLAEELALLDRAAGTLIALDPWAARLWQACTDVTAEDLAASLGASPRRVRATLRHLAEAGALTQAAGRWTRVAPRWVSAPAPFSPAPLSKVERPTVPATLWPPRVTGPEPLAHLLASVLGPLHLDGERPPPLRVDIAPDGRAADGWISGETGERHAWHVELPAAGAGALLVGQCVATVTACLRRALFAHAGAVAGPRGAWVLIGASGAGKTATVGRLVAQGATYLSDEVALLDPVRRTVAPFALPMAVKPWTLRAMGTLPAGKEVAREGPTRYYLPHRRIDAAVPLAALVLLRGGRGRPARLTALSPTELLLALERHPSSLATPERVEAAFAGFARLLQGTRCLTLAAPSPGAAASRLLRELG